MVPPCRWASTASPLYADGLLLVGDAGGMVNPFNGEGIDYALEAARVGAELVAQAMARAVATPSASGCSRHTPRS